MGTAAIILAAGSGERFGGDTPKQLIELMGVPILIHSVRAFAASDLVDEIVVVTSKTLRGRVGQLLHQHGFDTVRLVLGGGTRDASTRAALAHYTDRPAQKLLIHDAVRPLIDQATIRRCVAALDTSEAVVAVAPVTDTLFEVAPNDDGDHLRTIPNRDNFRRAQTPQAFRAGVLALAFARALADPDFATTDDIGVVHRYLPDVRIALVDGSPENLKVTTPADLVAAEALLEGS